MAAKKKAAVAKARLWLGCFVFFEEENDGTFQMLVEAANVRDALEKCEARLHEIAETSTLFQRGATVFLDAIVDIGRAFPIPALVNYVVGTARKSGTLWNDLPEQPDVEIETYVPDENKDGSSEPFVVFEEKAPPPAKKKAAAKKSATKKAAGQKKSAAKKR